MSSLGRVAWNHCVHVGQDDMLSWSPEFSLLVELSEVWTCSDVLTVSSDGFVL